MVGQVLHQARRIFSPGHRAVHDKLFLPLDVAGVDEVKKCADQDRRQQRKHQRQDQAPAVTQVIHGFLVENNLYALKRLHLTTFRALR